MRFVAKDDIDQARQDAETVMRVRAAMDGYWAAAGPGAMVSVSHVRDLLDPRGMWSLDPGDRLRDREPPPAQKEGPPEDDPRKDPMTGCLPVTAPGPVPPGDS